MYNPANWYWSGEPDGRASPVIYSSAQGGLTPDTDAAYEVWLAGGGASTPWPKDEAGAVTAAALDDVLTAAGLPATGLAPPSVPQSVTDKQFFQAAGQLGIITKPEAIAFMSNGAMPTSLATALATLPADEQYAATMAVLGARNFLRTDPFVVALSQAMGKTQAQVDALFTLAATL